MNRVERNDDFEETSRLAALAHYNILDTLPEQGYDDVTKLAAFICDVPISLVSLVAEDRQWFKSEFGLGARETPRDVSFCAHTIQSKETLIVADTHTDPRFKDNALVTGDPFIRFYAGAPIIEPGGNVLGTVCVIDHKPRELSAAQIAALEALARQTMSLLQQRKQVGVIEAQLKALENETLARQKVEEHVRLFTKATNDVLYQMNADWSVMHQLRGGDLLADIESADHDWLEKYIHPLDQKQVLEAIQHATATKSQFNLEHRVQRKDGSLSWTASRAIPILDASGTIVSWFGSTRDITLRKLTESALMQTEKLAVVGRLASTIAHEINNPLEAVTNLLYLAKQNSTNPEVQGWLEQADSELRRVSGITSQTLRFHRQATKSQPTSCESLVESTLSLYKARLRNSQVEVERRMRANRPVVCFEGDVRQILSNLVTNAIDAMPGGGRLLVRSREGTDWRTLQKGNFITIADTGLGMTEQTRRRVFEAFFTTKGIGGSGLGLWISSEIVKRHNGRILLRSKRDTPPHGTVLSLFLPFEMGEKI